MSASAVPEIREALALFEAWEASINDAAAARRFTEAVELLDDYRVERKDFSLWLEYAIAVVSAVGREADALMAANPQLKADFDAFAKNWGGAVEEALQRIQRGEGGSSRMQNGRDR